MPLPSKTAPDVKPPDPTVDRVPYGKLEGREVELFTLRNRHGLLAKITNYGGIVTELHTPDRGGKLGDIVWGLDSLDAYRKDSPYFGATVGRVGNRIRDAKFELDGTTYTLAANNAPHALHGGKKGWDKVVWDAEPFAVAGGQGLKLTYTSKDGEEGYPGNVRATTVYTLTQDDELKIEMQAVTDKATPINMVHHSYFNLEGQGSASILGHELTIFADAYTPGDPMVPTGKTVPVAGTPFDFRSSKPIGKDLEATRTHPVGYDHNFVVSGPSAALRPVARLKDPKSGRVLQLSSDQPGVQFYSGNFLDGSTKGKGTTHVLHSALCLESQRFPNSINVPAWKESVVLRPSQTYRHQMVFKFSAE